MHLNNLLTSHQVDKRLVKELYLDRVKILYPECEVFIPIDDPDFVILRKKVGHSTFGVKPNVFTVDIKTDVKLHFTELCKLT